MSKSSRKRGAAEIAEEIKDLESSLKTRRKELVDHPETIAAALPAVLVDKFVKTGRLTVFRADIDKHYDSQTVCAEPVTINQERWKLAIVLDKKKDTFYAYRWAESRWKERPSDEFETSPDGDPDEKPTAETGEGVWDKILEWNKGNEIKALAAAAFMALDKNSGGIKKFFEDMVK